MTTASYVDVIPTEAQIPDRNLAVMIVIADGEEGLLMSQVETIFKLSQFEVRRVLTSANLSYRKLTGPSLKTLQEEGLASHHAAQATFIPRESLRLIINELGKAEDRQLLRMLWPAAKPKAEKPIPRRSFRSSVVRALRKLFDDRRLMRQEIDELRLIVEDLLRADMNSMTRTLAQRKVTAEDLAAINGEDFD